MRTGGKFRSIFRVFKNKINPLLILQVHLKHFLNFRARYLRLIFTKKRNLRSVIKFFNLCFKPEIHKKQQKKGVFIEHMETIT